MKYGAAVVFGALGMFVSGYVLGFTTAVPDAMRAANLNTDGVAIDETTTFEMAGGVPVQDTGAGDPAAASPSEAEMEAMRLQEIQELKKMIVPLLTDDEIKKIREEASKPARAEVAPSDAVPVALPGEDVPAAP